MSSPERGGETGPMRSLDALPEPLEGASKSRSARPQSSRGPRCRPEEGVLESVRPPEHKDISICPPCSPRQMGLPVSATRQQARECAGSTAVFMPQSQGR